MALTAMNLLNYIDRFVVSALLPDIQKELRLSDAQAGLLATTFMVVYFVVSPIFGWLGDRTRRPRLLSVGVALWSLATAASSLVRTAPSLFGVRAAVGVGEAAYGSIAPSLITDWFERPAHGRALSYFYLATPVGAALGYVLGGTLGAHLGWRPAFLVVGLPGLALAMVALCLPEPSRRMAATPAQPRGVWRTLRETYAALWHNRIYVGTVAGYTVYTFALGGFAFWAPTYMMRVRGYTQSRGMIIFGSITALTGTVGTLTGGWLGDRLMRLSARGYTWLSVGAMACGSGLCAVALGVTSNAAFLLLLTLTQLCLFLNTGPTNALIVGSVPSGMRGTAMATCIFCIHLFGDAGSPWLLGRLSDSVGLARAMQVVPVVFALAGLVWARILWSGGPDSPDRIPSASPSPPRP